MQQELGTKIAFENDVNLAAIGEQWQGLGKGVENFVYLHLGTGVGMGMVLNGELYRGSSGAAGEVGYLPLAETDMRDPSNRRRGALDVAASATGVVADARRLGMPPPLTAKKVFEEARRGDRKARRVVAGEAHRIALAIVAVASVVDPELVILGGGIGSNGDLLLEPVGAGAPRAVAVPASRRGLHAAAGGDAVRLGVDGAAGGAGPVVRTRRGVRVIPDGARDRRPVKERGDQGQWLRSRRRETNMKRWLIAMATFALVAAACTASGGGDTPSAIDTGSGASHAPVTLEMWGAWTGRELKQFNKIFDGFTEKYPWITVNSTGGVDDQKILAAINAGDPPDTVLSFTLDSVGQFCATGAWQDLNPYIEQSGFDVSQFPPSVEVYTSYAGSRCAFPFLTDAPGPVLQHRHVREGGDRPRPPKTLSELQEDAKKLTVFNSDGSIKVAGFVPWFGYYEFSTPNLGNLFGAKWYNEDGSASAVDTDPQWKAMFQWQHDFIADVYGDGDFQTGADKLQRFVAGAGDEFSTANDFEVGRTAMNFDGEWRTAFIADEVPDLPYATAPYPVPDDQADTYGRGPVGGTIIGIPKGSPHPDEAWLLLNYMATDTDTLVFMANNVRNVPTTIVSLSDPGPGRDAAVPDVPGHVREPGLDGLQGAVRDRCVRPEHPGGVRRPSGRWARRPIWTRGWPSAAQQINDQLAQAAI